ncbi:MAG: hypothetical protein HQK76_07395 [Desulfobacterales bacterium]|nr:hypothetical protein [Desulfobacterales bacterium]
MKKLIFLITVFSLILIHIGGCTTLPASDNISLNEPLYIDTFLKHISKFSINQSVTLKGKYMGWKGSCKSAPPETRSDWMLEYNEACIYVSGPVPDGIDRKPGSTDEGKEVQIKGEVKFTADGKPYVKIAK